MTSPKTFVHRLREDLAHRRAAHNAQVAPLVFAAGRRLELVADAENRDTCYACADSTAQCDLQPGDVLTVTAAPQKLQLITFYDSEQFHAIENKLMRS